MGDFTKAVFDSKTIFEDEVLKKFENCNSRIAKLQFVDRNISKTLTSFTDNIKKISKQEFNQSFQDANNNTKASTIPPFFTPHPRYPIFSDKVGVRFEDCRGRYLVAEKKIQRGEIIAVESPIVAFPISHEWQNYCNHCHISLMHTSSKQHRVPVQCDVCQLVSWCSLQCQQLACQTHHRIMTQKTMKYFRENHQKLRDHYSSFGSESEHSLPSEYKTLFNLARHELTDSPRELEVCIVSIVFTRMLEAAGYFQDDGDIDDEEDRDIIAELISILIPIINVNTHPLYDTYSEGQEASVCAAVYPVVASTCNHSCDPNLVRATWDGRLVLAAGRVVEVGAELADMYTVHWSESETPDRREYLQKTFHFTCQCEACRENWDPSDFSQEKPSLQIQKRIYSYNTRMETEARLVNFISKHANNK